MTAYEEVTQQVKEQLRQLLKTAAFAGLGSQRADGWQEWPTVALICPRGRTSTHPKGHETGTVLHLECNREGSWRWVIPNEDGGGSFNSSPPQTVQMIADLARFGISEQDVIGQQVGPRIVVLCKHEGCEKVGVILRQEKMLEEYARALMKNDRKVYLP